ncbi:MAG: protoporphyrinogen oxidase [Verrucomicrobia bacterium]|nr:protoporphyrinogen oxidase [Verrucomicrobiota bacterium]
MSAVTPPAQSRPVAIVGGGITGLVAGYRLAQRGLPVVVYEAGGRVGGVIESIRENGFLAEFGPNSILETSTKISGLIRDLGLEPRRLYSDPAAENRYLVRGGRPVCLPVSPLKFFTTELFSLGAKLRLLREPFVRRGPAEVEESVAQFVLRRLGQEWLDYAINPMIAGIYAGDPARLSVQHGFPKLAALEQRYGSLIKGQILGAKERKARGEVSKQEAKKVSFDEGLQVLTDTLGEKLGTAVRLRSAVTRIEAADGTWRVTATANGAATTTEHCAVLLAAPAYRLAAIELGGTPAPGLAPLAEIHYPPVASVVLGFRREEVPHPLDGFGMLVPAVERFQILGTLFSSSLFPNRAPKGHVLLTTYVGGVRAPELALKPQDELVVLTVADLRAILGVRGQPTYRHCVVYPRAIPQYEVGYGRFKALMDEVEAKAPGVFLAGHFRNGISLGDSIIAGHDVAERIAGWLGQRAVA